MAKIINVDKVANGKFLELHDIQYVNDSGKLLRWEACQRANDTNAVSIFAIKPVSKKIILIKQFRPPIGKYCIECPAGLIEEGETAEMSARRELQEETGYSISGVLEHGYPVENSGGLTGELTTPIVAIIDESIPKQKQELEENEEIKVIEVELSNLMDFLNKANEDGMVVNGKLYAFAIGRTLGI